MRSSKRKQGDTVEANAGYKWTEVEQKRLKDLLDEGTLSIYDSAVKAKDMDEMFEKFSNNVIGYHLGQLRKKKLQNPESEASSRRSQVKSGSGIIRPVHDLLSQLGVVSSVGNVPNETVNVDCPTGAYELMSEHMPFLRFNYMKYDTKQEKVVVLIDLPGGTNSYDWEFNEVGDSITVIINWSKALYDVSNLFKHALNADVITMDHPKLHAMQNELLRQGFSSKNIPKGRIYVDLGRRVHKDDGTWKIELVQHDGNKIIMMEFSGFQEEVLKTEKGGQFL